MAGRKRGSIGRKVLWGVVGYGVTTLGTLLTTYLTRLHVSSLMGSILATTVGLAVVIVGVFIDAAKDGGGGEDTPQIPPSPAWPQHLGQPYQGGYYRPAPQLPPQPGRRRRSAAGIVGVLALVIVLCGGGGFG